MTAENHLIRYQVNLPQQQLDILSKYNTISKAEHIRRAIDKYIISLASSDVSASLSKGGNNGTTT